VENGSIAFIDEKIEAQFDASPLLSKISGCPDGFIWRGQAYRVVELIQERHDYHRRGRMARNMMPQHSEVAEGRGSWGVGRDYYRVRVESGDIFEVYYDRAPKDAGHRQGEWFLYLQVNINNTKE
jgi:hypothetical protein